MAKNNNLTNKFEDLRQQAEKLISHQTVINPEEPPEILSLIHELKIYQAELEIQNEELQRSQQEISDLHREYEDLFEFAPCGHLTLNNKGTITHLNLTGSRLLDTTRNNLLKRGLSQFLKTGWEHVYYSARARSAKTGLKQRIELPIKRKDKRPQWVQAEIHTDRNKKEEVLQWRILLLDITEQKEAEAALNESEVKFRKMMESISDPLYVCSADKSIQFINPSMIRRLGRDPTGETCYKAVHGLEECCEWCPFDKIVNGEIIEEVEISPLDNRSYRATHMPIVNSDHTVSKLTILKDIEDYLEAVSEKEKVQTQLQKSQKMESIGVLAGGIAHDFNNILTAILGFTELALDDAVPDTEQAEHLQEIYIAGKRARDLVRQILTFARQTNEEIKPLRIGTIVQESIKLLRSSIPSTVIVKNDSSTDSLVMANEALLQQVLMNLATNAMHAMEENGGVLSIELEDVTLDETHADKYDLPEAGDYVRIVISDTGKGISAEDIDHIFEPYFTTKEVGKGTGMGLALVLGTVEKYGGTIMAESRLGIGSVFSILLPTTKNSPKSAHKQYSALPHGTEKILFIDDEPAIAKMAEKILERLEYDVRIQTCSVEALELFQSNPGYFDLIITDMTMPHLTGDKLAVEIIKIRRDIPIILCTGYSNKISEEIALKIGIKAFAYKPLVKMDFANIVRKVLDGAQG